MSGSLGSWIVRLLLQHNEQYGPDLTHVWAGSRLCQLTEFTTYRRPEDPHAQVTARIADKTHTVRVAFDVDATDEFERSKYGEQPESLTSNLRSVFVLKRLRIRLEQPRARRALSRAPSVLNAHPGRSISIAPQGSEILPTVWLDVLDWEVLSGDRYDPIIAEHAQEVGRGEMAAEVAKVLRRWWTGESPSGVQEAPASPSDLLGSSPNLSIKREASASAEEQSAFDNESYRITLEEFLAPYLGSGDGKKVKPIPDWIFEVPSDAREQLDAIQVFGIDLQDGEDIEQSYRSTTSRERREAMPCVSPAIDPPPAATQKRDESQVSRRSQNDITPPSPPLTEERERSEIRSEGPPSSRSPSIDTDGHPSFASLVGKEAPGTEDSSDDEMIMRPTAVRARLGRAAQRALEAFTASEETHSRREEETARKSASLSETDEDGLSDYDLEQRRRTKRARLQQASEPSRSSPSTAPPRQPESRQDSNVGTDGSKPESSASASLIEAQRPCASVDGRVANQSDEGFAHRLAEASYEHSSYDPSPGPSPKRRRLDAESASQPASQSLPSPPRSSPSHCESDQPETGRTPSPDGSDPPHADRSLQATQSDVTGPQDEQKPADLQLLAKIDEKIRVDTSAPSRLKRKKPEQPTMPAAKATPAKHKPNPVPAADITRKRSPLPPCETGHGDESGSGASMSELPRPKPSRLPKLGGFKPDLRLRGGQSSAWLERITSGLRRTSDRSS